MKLICEMRAIPGIVKDRVLNSAAYAVELISHPAEGRSLRCPERTVC